MAAMGTPRSNNKDTQPRHAFDEWVFKMRGGLWTLLFAVILLMTKKSSKEVILIALIMIISGQLWRFWAAGSIGLYRGEEVKARELTTWGPYALMRNPLYFGNGLIGLGWSIIAGKWAVLIFVICFWLLYVKIIIPHEERFLFDKFGSEYSDWKKRTGRFWPQSWPPENIRNTGRSFNFNTLFHSEVHTLVTTVLGTCLIVARSLCYT